MKALALSPARHLGGSSFSFLTLPPPRTTHSASSAPVIRNPPPTPPPLLLPHPFQPADADVVLERCLPVGQVGEFHRLDHAVHDQRRAETGPQPEEEHPSSLIAAQGLHGGIIDDLGGATERGREIEPDPPRAEVDRVGHWSPVEDPPPLAPPSP